MRPDRQSEGTGSGLVREAIALAQEPGCRYVHVDTGAARVRDRTANAERRMPDGQVTAVLVPDPLSPSGDTLLNQTGMLSGPPRDDVPVTRNPA